MCWALLPPAKFILEEDPKDKLVPTVNAVVVLFQTKLELAPNTPSLLNCICPLVPAGFPAVAALNLGTHLPDTAS
jgi:hypothetical protein